MRGTLSNEQWEAIDGKLPTIDRAVFAASQLSFATNLQELLSDSRLNVAFVCLDDARKRFEQIVAALREAYACVVWYRAVAPDAPGESLEWQAIWTGKFYADYAPLLCYAAAEDIADFIVNFLNIEQPFETFLDEPPVKQELRNKKISSRAGKVGSFLFKRYPYHGITAVIDY